MLHEEITNKIIGAGMKVHSALGPRLLESTYQTCFMYELNDTGLNYVHQVKLPVVYRAATLDAGYRIDFLVENRVIVELNAVEKLLPLHTAQLLTYLKLSARPVGLLLNFNVIHFRTGIKRVVNGHVLPEEKLVLPPSSVSSASSVVER